jgi:hypothetical protein
MIEPGFYRQSNNDYHAGPGISKSGLARILRSPLHFKTPRKETAALVIGDSFHVATLEPERFEKEYAVLPANCSPGSGKGMKERKETFLYDAEQKGQTILSQADYDTSRAMAAAVHSNQYAIDLLSNGESELSGYWYDPENPDILCKLRMDWINKEERIIIDLKSTTDARYYQFRSSAFNNDYHMQSGWYLYGATHITKVEHKNFYFIVVEKEPPYGIKIYKADPEMINIGLLECQRALEIYADCLAKDEWPCYGEGIEILSPPEYLKQKILFD